MTENLFTKLAREAYQAFSLLPHNVDLREVEEKGFPDWVVNIYRASIDSPTLGDRIYPSRYRFRFLLDSLEYLEYAFQHEPKDYLVNERDIERFKDSLLSGDVPARGSDYVLYDWLNEINHRHLFVEDAWEKYGVTRCSLHELLENGMRLEFFEIFDAVAMKILEQQAQGLVN